MTKKTSRMNGKLLKINDNSQYILSYFFPLVFILRREDWELSIESKWGCTKTHASFRVSYDRDERVYYSQKLWSRSSLLLRKKRRRRKRGDADVQCKEMSENRSLGCALIKRVFEAHGREGGRNSRVTIFRHSFIPYGTKIHTTAHSPRADAAENKMRKSSRKKRNKRGGDEGCAHVAEMRDTLVWCTTSGLRFVTNPPLILSLSLSPFSAPLLKGNFHTRRSNC